MIQYNSKDAYLEIPKGLGNLGGNTGGEGVDLGPLSGSVVTLSAETVTVASNLSNLSATTENIASSVGSVATDLETVSGSVETLTSEVDSQGDAIADLILDSDALDTRVSGNTADIATLSGQVETLSSSTVTGLETAQNAANSANTLASSAYTLADSAYTRADAAYDLAESLTGATGGIEKVDELPATAEEGDVVWLNGQTGVTGYTVTAAGDNWASWPWELDRNYFNINDRAISIRGSQRIGKWTKTNGLFNYWDSYPGLIMRVRRNSTDGGPVYDFIDPTGQYTITAGSDAASITTNTFSRRGSLYVYSGGKWNRKAEREVYISESGTTVEDLVRSIWCDIEDADYDNLVIRYAPNGKELREFKIYISTFYGIDMQCSDDRETGDGWGRLNVRNLRIKIDGSIEDLVGEKWIVSEDQIQHTGQANITLDSTGAYTNPDELGAFSSEQEFKIWFRCNGANGVDWGMVPAKYIWRRIESINGEDKLVYYWAIENLFINGTAYKGSWHSVEWEWSNYVTDSWVAQ